MSCVYFFRFLIFWFHFDISLELRLLVPSFILFYFIFLYTRSLNLFACVYMSRDVIFVICSGYQFFSFCSHRCLGVKFALVYCLWQTARNDVKERRALTMYKLIEWTNGSMNKVYVCSLLLYDNAMHWPNFKHVRHLKTKTYRLSLY